MNKNGYAVVLALGSNLGDKQKNIEETLDKIEERIGYINALSSLHLTHPEGFESESIFVNCVCEVITKLDIYTLFAITKEIENEAGRTHKSLNYLYADRIIDIDLILAGDLVINTPELIIPHPRFHTRDFVLAPLCEIAPGMIHPLFGKTMLRLKEEFDQKQSELK